MINKLKENLQYLFPIISGVLTLLYFILLQIFNPYKLLAYVPDDAFYYFQISRNLLQGYCFSFDQITTTNGFHPLWLFLITPFFKIFGFESILPPLILGIILMVTGIVLFVRIIKHILGEEYSIVFSILLSFNPFIILFSVNGLETSLLIFFIAILFTFHMDSDHKKLNNYAIFGFLSGFLFLSRTDSIFLIIFLFISYLMQSKKDIYLIKLKKMLLFSLSFFMIVSPWLLFNVIRFGSPIQDSGTTLTYILYRELTIIYHWSWLNFVNNFFSSMIGFYSWLSDFSGYNRYLVLSLLLFTLYKLYSQKNFEALKFLLAFCFYFCFILLVSSLRMTPREWYIAPFIILPIFLLSYSLVQIIRRTNLCYLIAVLIAIVVFISNIGVISTGFYPHQEESPLIIDDMNKIFTSDERIGSSDAGITGFYANFHTINLDGLVNHQAFEQIKTGNMLDFLKKYNIRYFMIREQWKNDWYMGEGTGLYYADIALDVPSMSIASESDKPFSKIYLTKLLVSNDEIYSTYFKESILPSDPNAKKYLGDGWSDLIVSNQDLWSDKAKSNIYLPLKQDKEYKIYFTLSSVPTPSGYINTKVYVDNNYLISFKVRPNTSTYFINITNPTGMITKIEFLYEDTYNLKKFGYSNDDRNLAVNLNKIRIEELD